MTNSSYPEYMKKVYILLADVMSSIQGGRWNTFKMCDYVHLF